MIKTICDRCKRVQDLTGKNYKFDFFNKVLSFDLCQKCFNECINVVYEFVNNKNQTIGETNEQEKASNT